MRTVYIVQVVDPNTPMEETLYALDTLEGQVRYIGTSKHPSFMIRAKLDQKALEATVGRKRGAYHIGLQARDSASDGISPVLHGPHLFSLFPIGESQGG